MINSSTYLSRGAGFTGAADSKLFTFAMTIMLTGSAADQHILSGQSTAARVVIGRGSSNDIYILLRQSTGTTRVQVNTSALSTGQWYNILGSFDSASTANRHLYVNDTSDLAGISAYSDGTIDFTLTNYSVGVHAALSGQKFEGELCDFWVDFGRFVDFSITANRRLFFTSDNKVVNKGTDGSTPFGAAPIAFFSGSAASFATNNGGGGGMTTTGTLTNSAADPVGA